MLLLEHHGKALLRNHGIPTPCGVVVSDERELARALLALPERLVVKAQVAHGGRSKSGGIVFAAGPAETLSALRTLQGNRINGYTIDAVLVEERVEFDQERYAGILIQDGEIRLLFASRGGISIEEITVADSSNLHTFVVDPMDGPSVAQFHRCFTRLDYPPEYHEAYERIGRVLFAMCQGCDATMIEINPLVELSDSRLLALDARILIDDAALDRQPEIAALQPVVGARRRLPFRENPEGGTIGLIGLGGGLNVTLMDWIADGGAKFLDVADVQAVQLLLEPIVIQRGR